MNKRLLAFALVLMMLCGIVPLALADDRPVLVIARGADSMIENLDTNYQTRILEEKFNVDIQYVVYPASEAATKFGIIANSNSKMPDIACIGLDAATTLNMGNNGLIIPLDDFFADESLCPDWYEYVPEDIRTYMLNAVRSADGSVYAMPFYAPETWNEFIYRMWINQDWLDHFGLSAPTNTVEFRDMLDKFVNGDPNGNGRADEYGLLTLPNGYGCNPIVFLMNAFIQCNPDNSYFYVDNGVVKPAYTDARWLEGLKYLNDLCENKLISPLSFTIDWAQLQAVANSDTMILGAYQGGTASLWTGGENGVNGCKYDLIAPITGPDGFKFATRRVSTPLTKCYITSDCENPELAFAVMSYCYNHDMSLSGRFGEKGVNWTDDPAMIAESVAKYQAIGVDVKAEDIEVILLTNHWGEVQNENLRNSLPAYFAAGTRLMAEPQNASPKKTASDKCAERYYPCGVEEVISLKLYTEEEVEDLAVIKTAIDSYVQECTVAFVTGNMKLTEWDKFLDTLNTMQIDRYTQIMQNSYDRSKAL